MLIFENNVYNTPKELFESDSRYSFGEAYFIWNERLSTHSEFLEAEKARRKTILRLIKERAQNKPDERIIYQTRFSSHRAASTMRDVVSKTPAGELGFHPVSMNIEQFGSVWLFTIQAVHYTY